MFHARFFVASSILVMVHFAPLIFREIVEPDSM